MSRRPLLLVFALLLATVTAAWAADTRFSQSLAIGERAEIGFNRLSSDQIAALDALVRRDLAAQTSTSRRNEKDAPPAARFSQRLTADERAVAGLTIFNDKELTRLDEMVAQHGSVAIARALLAPPVFYPTGMRLRPIEPTAPTGPEIHGSFTLSYGMGKGGYSEKAGGMTLNYEDPKHNLAVSFSYWESHVKGGIPYRDDYVVPSPLVP
jgi:hypothetical protein